VHEVRDTGITLILGCLTCPRNEGDYQAMDDKPTKSFANTVSDLL
jgi:hypothetical protein